MIFFTVEQSDIISHKKNLISELLHYPGSWCHSWWNLVSTILWPCTQQRWTYQNPGLAVERTKDSGGNLPGSFTKSLAWRLLNPQGKVNYGYLFRSILFPHFSLSPSLLFPSLPSFIGSCYIQLCLKTVSKKPSCPSLLPQGLTGPLFSRVIVDIPVPDPNDRKCIW